MIYIKGILKYIRGFSNTFAYFCFSLSLIKLLFTFSSLLSFDYSVDVVVTSLAQFGYNYWYRRNQTSELLNCMKHSSADHLIVGGDFGVDFR